MSDELTIMAETATAGTGNPARSRYGSTCFTWAAILIAAGAAALFFGLSAPISMEDSEVVNMDLMQRQQLMMIGGMVLCATGALGMFIACLIDTVERRLP